MGAVKRDQWSNSKLVKIQTGRTTTARGGVFVYDHADRVINNSLSGAVGTRGGFDDSAPADCAALPRLVLAPPLDLGTHSLTLSHTLSHTHFSLTHTHFLTHRFFFSLSLSLSLSLSSSLALFPPRSLLADAGTTC